MVEPQRVYDNDQSEEPVTQPDLRALEGGGETSDLRRGHLGLVDNQEDSTEKSVGSESLKELEENPLSDAQDHTARQYEPSSYSTGKLAVPGMIGGGYSAGDSGSRFGRMLHASIQGRRKFIVGGGAGAGVIGVIIALFLTLLPLKINNIVENLQNHFFATANSAVQRRTDYLFSNYMKKFVLPKLGGTCSASTRTIDKSCINDIPGETQAAKLFRGWKDARLENKLANDYGIAITKGNFQGSNGSYKYKLSVSGSSDINIDGFAKGKEPNIFEAVGNRSDVRQKIHDALQGETYWKRVLYRFKVGRLLERKYGIKRCVFACKVKDNFADWKDKKTNKLKTDAAKVLLTQRVLEGRGQAASIIVACVVVTNCSKYSSTPGTDSERVDVFEKKFATALSRLQEKFGQEAVDKLIKEANTILDKGFSRYLIETVITKVASGALGEETGTAVGQAAGDAIPVVGQINTAANIVTQIADGTSHLKRWIFIANATAMVSVYMLYRSNADELKSGHVDAALLGTMVNALGNTANGKGQTAEISPLYNNILGDNQNSKTALLNIFSPQAYAAASGSSSTLPKYTCDNGKPIAQGSLICPEESLKTNDTVAFFDNLIHAPGLSQVIQVAQIWKGTAGKVFQLLSDLGSGAFDLIQNLPGVKQAINLFGAVAGKFFNAVASNLLPSPVSDTMSGARNFNMLAGGSDVAANDYSQYGLGGAKLSDSQVAQIRADQENQARQQFTKESFFARMFDKKSPYSLMSHVAMTMPLNANNFTHSVFASLFSNPLSLLTKGVGALFTTPTLYAATPQPDPFSVPQSGYSPNDPNLTINPDILTPNYCTKLNNEWATHDVVLDPSTGKILAETDLGTDPATGSDVHITTNPCLLESSTTGAAGGIFTSDVLTQADLTDPGGGSSSSNSGSSAGLVWPFTAKDPSQYKRIDQGWDLQEGTGGSVLAIAPGTLHLYKTDPGGFGNDYPVEELDSTIGGPSTWIYYGHTHILPSLNGQHVNAGQQIATTNTADGGNTGAGQNGSGAPAGWLEIGFAKPATDAPFIYGPEGSATSAGQAMHDILINAPVAAGSQ